MVLGIAMAMFLVPVSVLAEDTDVQETIEEAKDGEFLEFDKKYTLSGAANHIVKFKVDKTSVLTWYNYWDNSYWLNIFAEDESKVFETGHWSGECINKNQNRSFILPKGVYYLEMGNWYSGEENFSFKLTCKVAEDNVIYNSTPDIRIAQVIQPDAMYDGIAYGDPNYVKVKLEKGKVYRIYRNELKLKDINYTIFDGEKKEINYYETGVDASNEIEYVSFEATSDNYTYIAISGEVNTNYQMWIVPHDGFFNDKTSWCIDGEKFDCHVNYEGYVFVWDKKGDVRCFNPSGKPVINEFKCDDTYTYYFQADGTAMKDRLTYHPDGVHVIYFDEYGHEVFSNFANVKKTIAGEKVNDYCFFDVFGYLYVDVVTYDQTGTVLYYANPYGVLERGKWFQFSETVMCADGTPWNGAAGNFGYANADGTLMTNQYTYNWEGRYVYMQ